MSGTVDWPALDAAHVSHPYTQHATAAPPLPIVRADGAYRYDADGRPIFDAFSGTDPRSTFFHGHSFTANPIACAAARASLSLLGEQCE